MKKNMYTLMNFREIRILFFCMLAAGFLSACGKQQDKNDSNVSMEIYDPLYQIDDLEEIDLSVENHRTGVKRGGMSWDESLFYWLEDVDILSNDDGNIAGCNIAKTMMRNAANGNLIEYETYRDADTGEIYKVVGIEQQGSLLLLTDYYYLDGKPNFVFMRSDSIYTPTYATTDKIGKRFYFDQDTMVRYREIDRPREIREITLYKREVSYEQADYFAESQQEKQRYDRIEAAMLNEAYNVYEAMQEKGIGIVQGTIKDSAGTSLSDSVVEIFRKEDDVLLYRGKSQTDGTFKIYTYLEGTDCYMNIRGGDAYRDVRVDNVLLADSRNVYSYSLILCEKEAGQAPVQLTICDAMRDGKGISGAKLYFREGVSVYDGDIVLEAKTDQNGRASVELPAGSYTVSAECSGYISSGMTLYVPKEGTVQEGWLLHELDRGEIAVLLTWEDSDRDLDLIVYTPYQDDFGDMAHVYQYRPEDEYGNRIITENGKTVEAACLNAAIAPGSYKIYVADYSGILTGDYASDAMAKLSVCIRIYKDNVLCGEYMVPEGQNGTVWEAVQIMSSGQTTPYQRVYRESDVLRLYEGE